jgi:hypothetical protein
LPAAADPDNGQGCELSTFLLIDLLSIRDEGLTPRLLSKSEARINQPEAVQKKQKTRSAYGERNDKKETPLSLISLWFLCLCG